MFIARADASAQRLQARLRRVGLFLGHCLELRRTLREHVVGNEDRARGIPCDSAFDDHLGAVLEQVWRCEAPVVDGKGGARAAAPVGRIVLDAEAHLAICDPGECPVEYTDTSSPEAR